MYVFKDYFISHSSILYFIIIIFWCMQFSFRKILMIFIWNMKSKYLRSKLCYWELSFGVFFFMKAITFLKIPWFLEIFSVWAFPTINFPLLPLSLSMHLIPFYLLFMKNDQLFSQTSNNLNEHKCSCFIYNTQTCQTDWHESNTKYIFHLAHQWMI